MRRVPLICCLALLAPAAAVQVAGFTLLGPFAPWQTPRLGYNTTVFPGDILGGPMNLGEEYRWNVPTIYYSFSPDFLAYFGETAAAQIDEAIKLYNDLPSMDTVKVDDYPTQSLRFNYRARALNLIDMKSAALGSLIGYLGLTDPTRYAFTLRSRFVTFATNYFVVRRNFDPVTFEPSAFVNGSLWTYTTIIESPGGAESLAVTEPVDPLALGGLINAPVTTTRVAGYRVGGFWTGLTRDDVGGLSYLYRHDNLNVENAPPGATQFTPGTRVLSDGGSGGAGSPWSIVPTPPPGGTTTTPGGGLGVPGQPTGTSTNIIVTALRGGVGKIRFVRVNHDSLLGGFPSNSVSYVDRVITNGTEIEQTVVRPLLAPDILFDAADTLVGGDAAATFEAITLTPPLATLAVNNDAINGVTGPAGPSDGPGVMQPTGTTAPAATITFNKVGPAFFNSTPFFLSEESGTRYFQWASFDGSATPPVIYPNQTSIQEIERRVLGGGGGGEGGLGVSLVEPWTIVSTPPPGTTTGGAGGIGGGTGVGGGGVGGGGFGGTFP